MIRINRETDYGIGILSMLARDDDARVTAATLADRRGLPQPMVSKILKHLARAGILVSYRGAKGGYGLARRPEEITVAEIIAALEGPISLTECVEEGVEACQYSNYCTVSGNWTRINRVVHEALSCITLAEMSAPEPDMPGTAGPGARDEFPIEFSGVRYVSDV
ncbi:HTH-type transcriptional regulator CymR [wastewater metagenome]|uniref:HTH-type transcriptional regulator CymR n=2 Tax=unclassified sequences TaxID=12908 RepID=A0A5B8R808_9ZZZZ|nr:SUF system Fe-S cluster assembly regulator [Arhodomonas sp. KWT]QEA05259.1 HTH-type transcriptional regulator CymR [uncultured organism]